MPLAFRIGDPANPLFAISRGDLPAELALLFAQGLDGAFTDFSDVGVAVRAGLAPCD